jgi:septum formation protein
MKIILASGSPRRKELLGNIFPEFTIQPSEKEETAIFQSPGQFVCDLAKHKALDIASVACGITASDSSAFTDPAKEIGEAAIKPSNFETASLVIGADTIVYANDRVLGKPKDEADAHEMLASLSDKPHQVYTGICLIIAEDDRLCLCNSFYELTTVYVDQLSDAEIEAYIQTGDPLDKAGSYGIQGIFSKHIRRIDGDYFNVVGLPVNRLYRELITMDERFRF